MAEQWMADVTVKRPGVRTQTTERLEGGWWDLLGRQLPDYGNRLADAGARIVRIVLQPADQ